MDQTRLQPPFTPTSPPKATGNLRLIAKMRTRHKVVESARVLFTQRGYEAATIRDIAREAGLSTGAVFANFHDKSELFEAVLMENLDRVAERMREAVEEPHLPLQDRLVAAFSAAYAFNLRHLPLIQAMLANAWLRPTVVETRVRDAIKVLTGVLSDVLREGARRGEISETADVRLLAEMLWDAYVANYRRAIHDGWSLEALVTRMSDQAAVMLAGPGSGKAAA